MFKINAYGVRPIMFVRVGILLTCNIIYNVQDQRLWSSPDYVCEGWHLLCNIIYNVQDQRLRSSPDYVCEGWHFTHM